jgi:hypothetical protein
MGGNSGHHELLPDGFRWHMAYDISVVNLGAYIPHCAWCSSNDVFDTLHYSKGKIGIRRIFSMSNLLKIVFHKR